MADLGTVVGGSHPKGTLEEEAVELGIRLVHIQAAALDNLQEVVAWGNQQEAALNIHQAAALDTLQAAASDTHQEAAWGIHPAASNPKDTTNWDIPLACK